MSENGRMPERIVLVGDDVGRSAIEVGLLYEEVEVPMSKRLVEIDDRILVEARQALGTVTIKETVNTALRDAARAASRRSVDLAALRRFADATADLRNPQVMARAWE